MPPKRSVGAGRRPGRAVGRSIACLFLTLLIFAGGCAPTVVGSGATVTHPRLVDDWIAVMPDGAELPLEIWHPADHGGGGPRAIMVGLHGFGDYANAFRRLAPRLAGRSIAFYAYDQRGFGEAPHPGLWPGAGALVADALTVARLAASDQARRGVRGLPVYLLGESMGGAVAMLAAVAAGRDRAAPSLDGVILSAPAVWGRRFMPGYQAASLELTSRLAPWLPLTPRGLPIRPSDNLPMLRRLAGDRYFLATPRVDMVHGLVELMDAALAAAPELSISRLILYGERDELVPRRPTCAMVRALPADGGSQRVALYPNGHHMLFRDLGGPTVARDIAAWVLDPNVALPSGAEATPGGSGGGRFARFCADQSATPARSRPAM